jgi:hypothetical protein
LYIFNQSWISLTSREAIRASPRVCYILLSKSCDLPTPKIIWEVKKESLFKCMVFWTWQNEKKKAHESFKVFLSHQPPAKNHACMEKSRPGVTHAWRNRNGKPSMRAYICACGGETCQVAIDDKLCLPNCWRLFFLVLPKLDACQVEIASSWRCSNDSKKRMERVCSKKIALALILFLY